MYIPTTLRTGLADGDPEIIELAVQAFDAFEAFKEAYATLVDRASKVSPIVRARVDAYQPFTRDQGMGMGPTEWINEALEPFYLEITETGYGAELESHDPAYHDDL